MKGSTEQAFLKVFDEFSDAVFRRCYFKTGDRAIAEDLTQEAFVKTWNYLSKHPEKEIKNLKAFVFKVANNLIKDHYKKAKSKPFSQLADFDLAAVIDSGSDPTLYADVEQVMKLLERLEEEDRTLLILRFVEEWEVRDIADLQGERPNTVAVRIHRAKERFQSLLNELENNEA